VTVPAAAGVARLRRRGFWLEYASMAWMTAEAAVAVTAGVLASSIALVGFGLDSVSGPTPLPRSSSPRSPSGKVSKPGKTKPATDRLGPARGRRRSGQASDRSY